MINTKIQNSVQEFFKLNYDTELESQNIIIQKTKKEFEGEATVVLFSLIKKANDSLPILADKLGNHLVEKIELIESFNVVKGFLNLSINKQYWVELLQSISLQKDFGQLPSSGKTFMVEYASPNTNKPLHLGHLRNIFLGYAMSNILKYNGHDVIKTQIINDRGIHICKSMVAWKKFANNETPLSSSLKGDKLVGKYYVIFDKEYKKEIAELISNGMDEEQAKKEAPIFLEAQETLRKWEENDPETIELWKTMNQWVYDGFDTTYKTMNVDFDKIYYESTTYLKGKDIIEKGVKEDTFYQKEDNSIWVDLSKDKMDDKLLLRADGTSVYMTQDIGTAILRFNDYPNMNGTIYTVGNEQNHHFKVLFTTLDKLGYEWAEGCHHLSYGMVELPSGKMKSREGTVVDADDIMQEVTEKAKISTQERGHIFGMDENEQEQLFKTIGIGALKYYLLKIEAKKNMLFNPEESIDLNGNTAPFIQYVYARIQSILRKAEIKDYSFDIELNPIEKDIIIHINDLPEVIFEAGQKYNPSIVASHVYHLAKLFNSFYQSISILSEENKDILHFRLSLCKTVGEQIKTCMNILGIDVPDRM